MRYATGTVGPSGFAVRPLRSGSSGNLTLVAHRSTVLLLDAGLPSERALDSALAEVGCAWEQVDGLLVSHLHGDHFHPSAVAACARHEVPVFLHERNVRIFSRRVLPRAPVVGTGRSRHPGSRPLPPSMALAAPGLPWPSPLPPSTAPGRSRHPGSRPLPPSMAPAALAHPVHRDGRPSLGTVQPFSGSPFTVGAIGVRPFPVPHDAEGVTSGFVLTGRHGDREVRVTVATDLGHGGNGLFEEFVDSDLILIESNYDPAMLAASGRRDKGRVGSDVGHLSNEQAGRFLARVLLESRKLPKAIVLCHLSADHNTPARAVGAVREILCRYGFAEVAVHAARRHGPSPSFCAVDGFRG